MTKAEQEVVLTFDGTGDSPMLYASHPAFIRAFKQMGLEVVREDKRQGEGQAVTFRTPHITPSDMCKMFRRKKYTEEEKAALLARLKK